MASIGSTTSGATALESTSHLSMSRFASATSFGSRPWRPALHSSVERSSRVSSSSPARGVKPSARARAP